LSGAKATPAALETSPQGVVWCELLVLISIFLFHIFFILNKVLKKRKLNIFYKFKFLFLKFLVSNFLKILS
jgi:hypothetical protein